MKRNALRLALLSLPMMLVLGVIRNAAGAGLKSALAVGPQAVSVREGLDFATLVLHDPWDMSEFTDISQYLNVSGQSNLLTNISVTNGIFSAQSVTSDPSFFTLFPGYYTAMLIGKVGARFPIDRTNYHCIYIAQKATAGSSGQVFWFQDERLNVGGLYGSLSFTLSPGMWKLYSLDLATGGAPSPWTALSAWEGLRVDPTSTSGATFEIDWVRLTDCVASNLSLSSLPAGTLDFYVVSGGNEIWVTSFTPSGGNATVDLQGVAAGSYTYSVKDGVNVVQSGSFTITQTPVADFVRPSPISGVDYATTTGDPWDMASNSDENGIFGINSWSFANGLLTFETPSGTDAQIELYSRQPIANPGEYRYVTFRLFTDDVFQNVPEGMIVRWVWVKPGPGGDCYLASHDIPIDVGWQTYTIDLSDLFNGTAEVTGGACSGVSSTWSDPSAVSRVRFDPNENILGYNLTQQLDWVRLTKVETVDSGTPLPIQIALNQSVANVPTRDFYYTTDPVNDPTQNAAVAYVAPTPGPVALYLPLLQRGDAVVVDTLPQADVTFFWDTSAVSPGTYYTCVHVEDTNLTNSAYSTYCSQAPIIVQ